MKQKLNLEIAKEGYANGISTQLAEVLKKEQRSLTKEEKQKIIDNASIHYGNFLNALGCNWEEDPNSADTPKRVAKKFVNDMWKGRYTLTFEDGVTQFPSDNYSGIVLEKKESIEGMELLRIEGIDEENLKIGKPIQNVDSEQLSNLCNIHSFLKEKEFFSKFSISKLEVNDFVDLKLYVNELYISLGTTKDINDKISKAFSILEDPELSGLKGYIDVSFDGNPVIYRKK